MQGIVKELKLTQSRYAAPAQPEKLEQALYQPFASVLTNDVEGKRFMSSHSLLSSANRDLV